MSKEESLIPSVRSILEKEIPYSKEDHLHICYEGVESYVINAMKAYGEEVRRITLQLAADNAYSNIEEFEDGCTSFVEKDSILNLNDSDNLKIT